MDDSDGLRAWAATAVVAGCPLTPGEVRALARLLPVPVRVRVTHQGESLLVRAEIEHVDARAAADRLRRDVPRILAGFPGARRRRERRGPQPAGPVGARLPPVGRRGPAYSPAGNRLR